MIDKLLEMGMLYDFYGDLLTERQNNILQYYYYDNYSFAEISELLSISRQAVYDAIHKAEISLLEYEKKLGLAARFKNTESNIIRANKEIDILIREYESDDSLIEKLHAVKNILSKIDD